mmetsp:Transcript_9543/g.30642  ORF Transcript_9543/g.30642 Transcript_9543/m.30642 type:complete len:244 (+) Transcript_9543:34-765(+)
MERTLFLASAFWLGGAAAWAPIAGYLLAPHCRSARRADVTDGCDASSPSMLRAVSELQRQHVSMMAEEAPRASPPQNALVRPKDASALMSERDRMRLAPVHQLKRKRRSRKIRTAEPVEDKLMPLVPGARQSVTETIIAAYSGDTLETKQRAGEDYWVDPAEAMLESQAQRRDKTRLKRYRRKESKEEAFKSDKLKSEISAPYKNNIIGYLVLAFGAAAVFFNFFPSLLELPDLAANKFPEVL